MGRIWIVVGDTTTGGGTVVSGSPFTDIDGKPVARIGDSVVCLRHGPTVIVSGDSTMIIDGQPVARHGDGLACLCSLVSVQQMHVHIASGGSGAAASASAAEKSATTAPAPTGTAPASPPSPAGAQPAPATPPSPVTPPAPACWVDDHEKAISVQSSGRYYEAFDKNGVKHNYNMQRKFKVICPLKSGGNVRVEVRIKVAAQSGVVAADVTAAKTALETGVSMHWTNKFKLEITDQPCGTKTLPIEYKVIWVTSGEDYTMKVHQTYPREGVTGLVIDVSKTTTAWIYAHEFGHCVGVPDEYSYTTDNETVQYYKPDGSLDSTVVSAPPTKPASDTSATIMSTFGNTTVLARHVWSVAREVQELLTSKIGRPVTCNVI